MSQTIVPIFGAAAFVVGAIVFLLPTVPAFARFLSEEA
jgi:hypothetical protein